MELNEKHKILLEYVVTDDAMGLWIVLRVIGREAYFLEPLPAWIRQEALKVIQELLDYGLIEVGTLALQENGEILFEPLSLPVDKAINYIEKEWDCLGRTPSISDICWFRATAESHRLVNEVGLENL